jgi:hypothetical protein
MPPVVRAGAVITLVAACASVSSDSRRESTYYVPWINLGASMPAKVTCREGPWLGVDASTPPTVGLLCWVGEDWSVFKEIREPSGVVTRSWYTTASDIEYQRQVLYPDGGVLFLERKMCGTWARPAPGQSPPEGGGYSCAE